MQAKFLDAYHLFKEKFLLIDVFDMIGGMINETLAKIYCSEDLSLIENYHQAISDKEKMWDVHHRRECDDEGRTLFTHKQLKEMNLYFNRPAFRVDICNEIDALEATQ